MFKATPSAKAELRLGWVRSHPLSVLLHLTPPQLHCPLDMAVLERRPSPPCQPNRNELEGTLALQLWATPSPSGALCSQLLGFALTRQSLGVGVGGRRICKSSSHLYWFKNKAEQIIKEDCLFSLALSDLSVFLSTK